MSDVPLTDWVGGYEVSLQGKAPGTQTTYRRVVVHLTSWIAQRPGSEGGFHPRHLTRTALESYLAHLEREGYSLSHRHLAKAVASSFARWLIDQGYLIRNPAHGLMIPAQPMLAPRLLTENQRYVLRNLVEREGGLRGAAIFALGYWAGCRVSDVAWLRREHTHLSPRTGWLLVGHKGGKNREIDLVRQAHQPLREYLDSLDERPDSPFVFPSQRADRLTEAGIHHWFRTLKAQAKRTEWELIHDITFHDLRHDFAHRAREAGWSLEEVAFYLGHITTRGTPALQTTVRYTQASRTQIKQKLALLTG